MKTVVSPELSDFDYFLPPERVAQYPLPERTDSRLLVLDRKEGRIDHRRFYEIIDFLQPRDVLVLNDTRVFPARLWAHKATGGRVEILLIRELQPAIWEVLARPSRRVPKGMILELEGGEASLVLLDEYEPGPGRSRKARVHFARNFLDFVKENGHVPLPPYIRRTDVLEDRERYQTVFARREGAVAAPTAGLHFDEELLRKITALGVSVVMVTLHVGYGTFQPVRVDEIKKHEMHEEYFEVTEEVASRIRTAKEEGQRIFACGTTTVRALESAVDEEGEIRPKSGRTKIFIYPPYDFRIVDHLITNFHLPCSTLLMLVSAFAGREQVLRAYEEAIAAGYRFYSYGDAMLIL